MTFDEVILDKVILVVYYYIFQFTKTKFHSANEWNRGKVFLQNLIGVDSRLNEVEGEIIESKKTKNSLSVIISSAQQNREKKVKYICFSTNMYYVYMCFCLHNSDR